MAGTDAPCGCRSVLCCAVLLLLPGLKRCPDCVPLWRAAARLEEAQGSTGRARAMLEQVGGAGCTACCWLNEAVADGLQKSSVGQWCMY